MDYQFTRRGRDAIVDLPTKQWAREILRIAKNMADANPALIAAYQEILESAQSILRTKPITIRKNVY